MRVRYLHQPCVFSLYLHRIAECGSDIPCAKGSYCANRPNSIGKALRVCDTARNCFKNNDAVAGQCSVTFCDGIAVQGSTNQPQFNGCYLDRNNSINGFQSYQNSRGVLLYWQKTGRRWCLGTDLDQYGGRASGSGEAGPVAILSQLWMTYNRKTNRWQHESLMLSSGLCSIC